MKFAVAPMLAVQYGATQNGQGDETLMLPHKVINQICETASIRHLDPSVTFFSFAVIKCSPITLRKSPIWNCIFLQKKRI
jgi:hypothetical protein